MNITLKTLAIFFLAVALVGCKDEAKSDDKDESIWKGLETPVDRSRSKGY